MNPSIRCRLSLVALAAASMCLGACHSTSPSAFADMTLPTPADMMLTTLAFQNSTNIGGQSGTRPEICQTQACATYNSGKEVLFDRPVNGPAHVFQMSISGACVEDVSLVYTGLPSPTQYNCGNARYSPDGHWILIQCQDAHTALLYSSAAGDIGTGLGNGLFVCNVSTGNCTELPIIGDNTGHFCAAGAICPVQSSLSTYFSDDRGVLHWYFTPDQSKIYGMYVMGSDATTLKEKIHGTLRWATIELGAAPALSEVMETDVGPLGDGTGANNWYEGAGAMPTSVEPTTQTLFATSVGNSDGALLATQILRYNISTGEYAFIMPPTNTYTEFWAVRPQGDVGVGSSTYFVPGGSSSSSTSYSLAPPLDLVVGAALTSANLVRGTATNCAGCAASSWSHGSWDWTGNLFISDLASATSNRLYLFNYSPQ